MPNKERTILYVNGIDDAFILKDGYDPQAGLVCDKYAECRFNQRDFNDIAGTFQSTPLTAMFFSQANYDGILKKSLRSCIDSRVNSLMVV